MHYLKVFAEVLNLKERLTLLFAMVSCIEFYLVLNL
jgi:hypothetical protein